MTAHMILMLNVLYQVFTPFMINDVSREDKAVIVSERAQMGLGNIKVTLIPKDKDQMKETLRICHKRRMILLLNNPVSL